MQATPVIWSAVTVLYIGDEIGDEGESHGARENRRVRSGSRDVGHEYRLAGTRHTSDSVWASDLQVGTQLCSPEEAHGSTVRRHCGARESAHDPEADREGATVQVPHPDAATFVAEFRQLTE